MHDRVVATGKPQISDLIMGAVLKRPILTVGVPVFRDGEVVYVLAMGLGPETLSALMQDQKLSSDWTAAILDRKGTIVGRNREYRSLPRPASRADASPEADRGHRELDPPTSRVMGFPFIPRSGGRH